MLVILIGHILRKVKKRSTRSQTQLGASMQVLTQLLQGIRTVKAYRAEERELERFAAANRTWVHEAVRLARTTALSGVWTILYTHAGLGLIVLLVGWLAVSGRMSRDAGEMLAFFMLISRSYASIKRTTRALGRVAVGRRPTPPGLFAEPLDIVDGEAGTEANGLGAGVRFEGVGFRYRERTARFQGLDLELRARDPRPRGAPAGRRPWSTSSPASSTRPRAASRSTAWTCVSSPSTPGHANARWSRGALPSTRAWRRTSATAGRRPGGGGA